MDKNRREGKGATVALSMLREWGSETKESSEVQSPWLVVVDV